MAHIGVKTKGIDGRFQFIHICIYKNFLQLFYSQQNCTFWEARSGWNRLSFVGATWLTFNWKNRFIYGSYLSIPLNGLQIQRFFDNIRNFMKNRHLCEISLRILKNQKCAVAQKISRILKFWSLHANHFIRKRADMFQIFPRKGHFLHFFILKPHKDLPETKDITNAFHPSKF